MKYAAFYAERIKDLPSPNEKGEVAIPCVFHKDSSPSLSINLESGKWKCFSPSCIGHKGGGWKRFNALLNGEAPGDDGRVIAVEPIQADIIEGFHNVLLTHTKARAYMTERGISEETLKRFHIGFDSDRYWIPIPDREGQWVNVRKYKRGATGGDKIVAYATGYNQPRLFPIENLESDTVVLVEGEWDCLLACQLGFPAVTVTGGAGTWPKTFSAEFKGKQVFVCYDVDEAGVKGGNAVAMALLHHAREVRRVTLPLKGTSDDKDFSDYIVKRKHTAEDFRQLLSAAPLVEVKTREVVGPSDETTPLHLSEIGQDQFVGKRIKSTVLIAGKDLAPFQVPHKIAFSCEMGEKICAFCGICKAGGQTEITIPEWDPQLLQMVGVHQLTVDAVLARIAQVPGACRKFKVDVKDYANIEAVKAIPEIDFASERSEYVIRQLYYLGHGLETNHTYDIQAVVMPDPKTQYATAVIYDAKSSQDSIELFENSEGMRELLSIFKRAE